MGGKALMGKARHPYPASRSMARLSDTAALLMWMLLVRCRANIAECTTCRQLSLIDSKGLACFVCMELRC
jgi:hypothetical protein